MSVKDAEKIHLIAHKLNSPLTALMGYISMAKRELKENPSSPKTIQWLEDAEQTLESLKQQIKDLNDLTRSS